MGTGLQIGLNDIVQIAVLYIAIYALIRFVKGTRSAPVLLGFCLLVAAALGSSTLFRFDVLSRIIFYLLIYLALSLVVVFQQEIRRILALLGGQGILGKQGFGHHELVPEILCRSVLALSKQGLGALIAVERGVSLRGYEDSGVKLNALVSRELMISIFTPPLPLHDGGIIIRNGRISSAHCIFPVSNQGELISSGMRHRAAVGLSEETDALVLVVSEETGKISLAHDGRLHRYAPDDVERLLLRWLRKSMPKETHRPFSLLEWLANQLRLAVRRAKEPGKEGTHESQR
ncbi:MAG: diadenylate cyclase [Kiritimatiellae bacterium]|nr:diadenylate cyclase [Kiritimatiellia bacterium]